MNSSAVASSDTVTLLYSALPVCDTQTRHRRLIHAVRGYSSGKERCRKPKRADAVAAVISCMAGTITSDYASMLTQISTEAQA